MTVFERLRMPSLGGATEWLNSEHITFVPFTAPDHMCVLGVDPERVSIQTSDGRDWCTESMVREHARDEPPTCPPTTSSCWAATRPVSTAWAALAEGGLRVAPV